MKNFLKIFGIIVYCIVLVVCCTSAISMKDEISDENVAVPKYTISPNHPGFETYSKEIDTYARIYHISTEKIYVYKIWYQSENLYTSYIHSSFGILVYSSYPEPAFINGNYYIRGIDGTVYTRFAIIKPIR